MPDVRLVNLTKTFDRGRIVAVDHINLHVRDGEYFTLLGPSGCGKTTTLRMIAGLIEPDEGEIYIGDRLVTNLPPEERDVGFVFQEYALFPHMNVWENVTYGPLVKAWDDEKRIKIGREMLEMVKLYDRADAAPHELSGGMMQRVALARALAVEPAVLLLDEPFGALDARLREELLREVRRVHGEVGFTALHVTHDQAEALAVADRLAVLREGRIVRVGRVEEVVREPMDEFVARFLGANVLRGDAARALGVEVAAFYPEEVEPDPGGVEARVVAVSFSRSGYRVRATVDGQEVEVLWPGRPGERIRFRPRRLLRLTPR